MNFCFLSHSVYGILSWQPKQTYIGRHWPKIRGSFCPFLLPAGSLSVAAALSFPFRKPFTLRSQFWLKHITVVPTRWRILPALERALAPCCYLTLLHLFLDNCITCETMFYIYSFWIKDLEWLRLSWVEFDYYRGILPHKASSLRG